MNIKLIKNNNQFVQKETDPIAVVLSNRGIPPDKINEYFAHDWSQVQEPYFLDNIREAADLIISHCEAQSSIAILVDSDFDGFASSAILTNYLTGYWPDLKITHILHESKKHGLDDTEVMKQLRDIVRPALLIIPDASGSTAQYKALNEIGIQTVTLDHHDDMARGDNKDNIVVNNQQSENYWNKSLCGTGVVWQLLRVFDYLLEEHAANTWLDIVAAAHAADVMDFRSQETRFLVIEGLQTKNIKSLFLKQAAIDMSYSLQGDYNFTNVSWYIAPLFNAIIRIGTIEEKQMLFKCLLDRDAAELVKSGKRGHTDELVPFVQEGLRQATNGKARQKRQSDKLSALIDDLILRDNLLVNRVLIITIDDFDESQKALSGLIANKLQEMYSRPVILLFKNKENGNYYGSLRAPSNIEAFLGFREFCEDSRLCIYASGHSQAAGFAIFAANIPAFQDYCNDYFREVDMTPTFNVDFIFDAADPSLPDTILALAQFKDYWGANVEEPIIAVTNVVIDKGHFSLLSQDKNPTLKITTPSGVALMKFKSSREEFESLLIDYDGEVEQAYTIDAVGEASVNEWNGTFTPQILIKDYSVNSPEFVF